MSKERPKETGDCVREQHSHEPCAAGAVRGSEIPQRADPAGAFSEKGPDHDAHPAAKKRGRPKNQWRIRVIRIDAEKYPGFQRDRDHPFASMAAEARIEEIDSFCARLWARTLKSGNVATERIRGAAA
jgi:hypothetical protein